MAHFDHFAPGQFSWVDLMATDRDRARAFYGALFGWESDDTRDDTGGAYSMFRLGGVDVAGMGVMGEELRTQGVPSFWSSYVTVEDVDAAVARATSLGAQVRLPALAVETDGTLVGRMAILADPEGAAICLWQAGQHAGAGMTNEVGSFGWNELCSRDVEGAKRFYGDLFGWEFHGDEAGDVPGYQEIRLAGRANGGILPWREEMGPMPPAWTVYFSVADCDDTVKRIQELGGQIFMPPTDIEPGRFAVASDPDGAVFNVMKINAPD